MIDLDLRSSRLDKEAQKRREEARRKRERELALQKEQARREQELAARAAQKREEDEREQIARQLVEAEEQRLTGGIRFTHRLSAYKIDGEDDKVILPENCLAELTQQDAFTRGAMCFRLVWKRPDGHTSTTHCGVREFSAPAGSVGIPKKVLDSLSIDGSNSHQIEIKYVLLPKCTFAKLQPRHNTFIEVGPVKMCLEENLRFHTALSVGDVLTVWYRGKAHELCVTEMRPEASGTLIDTDVEIDLELSQEYLQHQQQQEQGARRIGDAGSTTSEAASRAGTRTPSPSVAQPAGTAPTARRSVFNTLGGSAGIASAGHSRTNSTDMDISAHATAVKPSEHTERLRGLLDAEPEASAASGAITVKVKLPSGATKTRKFTHSSPFTQLFLYVALEVSTSTGEAPTAVLGRLQLSTRFPARSLRWSDVAAGSAQEVSSAVALSAEAFNSGSTFSELGMTGTSEAVFASLS